MSGQGDEAAMVTAAVAGRSLAEIAAAGQVSISTIQRRLKDPVIAGLVQEGRTQQRRQLIGQLNELAELSMHRLRELVAGENSAIAVRAITGDFQFTAVGAGSGARRAAWGHGAATQKEGR